MIEYTREMCLKAKTVWKHEIHALLSKFRPEIVVTIKNLPDDGFRRGDIGIAFINRRTGYKPSVAMDPFLQLPVSYWIVLLHHLVPPGTGEIEHIIGIGDQPVEIIIQSRFQVRINCSFIVPSPFGVEMSISDRIKYRCLRKVIFRICLRMGGK